MITDLPGGRTELRFTSPAFAEFRSLTYSMRSVVAADAVVGAALTNVINLITSDGITGPCGDPAIAVCDAGSVRIISSAEPTIAKSGRPRQRARGATPSPTPST